MIGDTLFEVPAAVRKAREAARAYRAHRQFDDAKKLTPGVWYGNCQACWRFTEASDLSDGLCPLCREGFGAL